MKSYYVVTGKAGARLLSGASLPQASKPQRETTQGNEPERRRLGNVGEVETLKPGQEPRQLNEWAVDIDGRGQAHALSPSRLRQGCQPVGDSTALVIPYSHLDGGYGRDKRYTGQCRGYPIYKAGE